MGRSIPAFLAFSSPICHRLDGQKYFSIRPLGVHGMILLMPAIAHSNLELALIRLQGKDSQLAKTVGKDFKEKLS